MKGIRVAVFFFTLIGVILMSFWTVPAFWQHIQETGDGNRWAPYVGAMAPEIVCLMLVFIHSFFPYISVRHAALWLGALLAAITIFHSVAMRGMSESINQQVAAEGRMKESLTASSAELADSMSRPLLAERDRPGTSLARKRQIDRELSRLRTELGANAQNNLAKEISGSTEKIYTNQVVSPGYIKNYGFLVLLGSSMLVSTIIGYLMMTKEKRNDYDADFDGIPDHQQGGASRRAGFAPPSPKDAPLPSAARSGAQSQ